MYSLTTRGIPDNSDIIIILYCSLCGFQCATRLPSMGNKILLTICVVSRARIARKSARKSGSGEAVCLRTQITRSLQR